MITTSYGYNKLPKNLLHIVQPISRLKVRGIRFHTKIRRDNKKTYTCGAILKGTTGGDSNCIDYYGVLGEVLKVKYLGEPINCVSYSM